MEFSRQEYRSELPFPPPGDLPDPGIECTSLALAHGFFTTEPPGKPCQSCVSITKLAELLLSRTSDQPECWVFWAFEALMITGASI